MPKIIDEEQVFRAVVELLTEKGYENATTKELAAAAGMHEVTLFRKYESKAKLVGRAIEYQLARVPLAHLSYTGDLEADLLAIVEAYIETNKTHGAILPMLFIELPRHPELREIIVQPLANITAIFQIILRYQTQGQLKPEPPIYTFLALVGWMQSYYMFLRAVPDYPVLPLDPQAHIGKFLYGRKA